MYSSQHNIRKKIVLDLVHYGSYGGGTLTMERKKISLLEDIADYAKDGRLTEPSDGKRYEWRKMIEAVKSLGRPLTDEEAEQYRIK